MIGKIVSKNQRDWDTLVPFVMAAYRASVHDSTGYTPNILAFGREVRAPLDISLGPPKEEAELWQSHDEFVANQQERMRCAYSAVRENLRRCAERRRRDMICESESKTYAWVPGCGTTIHADGRIDHQVDKELRRADVGNKGVITDVQLHP